MSPDEVKIQLGLNVRMAHEALFYHRHSVDSPAFHLDVIDLMHSEHAKGIIEGFRSSAKSTRAEEAVVIKALYRRFRNCVLVGSSFPRAKERLAAIKNELTVNENITYLFGKQEGETWGEGKIILTNGVCIQAVGQGMSVRGMKHLDARPDFALIDDLEDEETVKDPTQRDKMLQWVVGTFMPALSEAPPAKIRMLGNRLDDDAVIVRLSKDRDWKHLRIPIMELADDGVERYDLPPGKWRATWPGMFPLEKIGEKRAGYERLGMLQSFNCEYMCEASDPQAALFKRSQEKTHAGVRTWQSVFAAYDPARTASSRSAMTGYACFSWVGSKLVVWKGDAQLWLPDQIIDSIFQIDAEFKPVEIGVEPTGLEEFIMQPLRHEAVKRRTLLPLRRLDPPRGKTGFIRGLQPFFKSGEIEFVDVSDEARGQLLSFPTGRMDFPNALAYALLMRPGLPVYPEWSLDHVQTLMRTRDSWYFATNATGQYSTGVLIQIVGGQLRIHDSWVREGPPGEVFHEIMGEARAAASATLRVRVPPITRGSHDTVGLRPAILGLQTQYETGGDVLRGRQGIRGMLMQYRRGEPLLAVSSESRWALNGFAGGFARTVDKKGQPTDEPKPGPYQVLMEGLESFVARYRGVEEEEEDDGVRYAESGDRRYKTILPSGRGIPVSKDRWHEFDGHDIRTSVTIMPRR
jgi:hypothetical protein